MVTSRAGAQQIFQTTFKGRVLFCAVSQDGTVSSGKVTHGRFRKDPSIRKLRKKVKAAKSSGNTESLKTIRKKLKTFKSRLAVCTRERTPQGPPPGSMPPADSAFGAAFAVLQAQCASCHTNSHTGWRELVTEGAWLAERTVADAPLIDQDDLNNSPLLRRIRTYGGPIATMPMPNLNAPRDFSDEDFEIIRRWVLSLGNVPGEEVPPPSDSSGNQIPSAELFSCTGSPLPSEPRLRRIGQREWAATLGLRGTDAEFNPLSPDPNHQYSTYAESETLNETILNEYFNYLPHTRTGWIDGSTSSNVPRPPEHRCMILEAVPSDSCIRNFLVVYLRDFVLFREPTTAEVDRLFYFAQDAVANGDRTTQASRSAIMEQITSAAWLSTAALFRSEVGKGEVLSSGETLLSDEELGKSLAYALTDQGPGNPRLMQPARVYPALPRIQAIEDAVRNGSIGTPETLDSLVDANFSGVDPNRDPHYSEYWMGEKIEQFFIEWLGIGGLATTFHETPSATADVGGALYADRSFNHMKKTAYYGDEITLAEQAVEMIARIVNHDQNVIENLFTSRDFYLPSNLESNFTSTESPQLVYGVVDDIAANREARWRTLPSEQRAGILTHPAWLAAHSDNFENGPSAILRGKWIRENVLCGIVPDVPVTVDASFPPSTAHLSARQRLELSTGQPQCQGCHALMNPLGLPFEMYNHAGFLRATDHGSAPSGRSSIILSGDSGIDGDVRDAVEFSERLARNPLVEQCFTRQVFRYFMGREEKHADACTLTLMRSAYQSSGGSMKAMVQALIKSPTFTMRVDVAGEQ